jgi:hypothetical protein
LVREDQLADPVALVATLAHELAHDLLLPAGHLSNLESDHEYVTDLLVVFLGLGVFGANAHIRESYRSSATFYSWSIGKQGYLSERMYAYALALFAWVRKEHAPAWARHLRANVREPLRQGLRYLVRTGDTQFREVPEDETSLSEAERLRRRVAALKSPSSGARLAALRDLREAGPAAAAAVPDVVARLRDQDRYVRVEAASVLGAVGPAAEAAGRPWPTRRW